MNISAEHLKILDVMSRLSIDRASRALSKTLKTGAKISFSKCYVAEIGAVTEKMNESTDEMAGVMVGFKGNVGCKLLFMIPMHGVFILTDLYLRQPSGTTKTYDECSESVMQELGNVLAAHICNSLVSNFDATLTPLPPVVHNDYAGVMFSNLIMEQAMMDDKLVLIDTKFEICKTELACYLFLVPDVASFDKLIDAIGVYS
jgi:chemotaxis protein CheC